MVTSVNAAPHASQARSRKTRQLILTAAVEVLVASGIDGFTMLAVSQGAGVSVGSIYRRFGGKDQLLFAAQHEFISNFQVEFAGKLAGYDETVDANPDRRVEYAVAAFVSTFRDNRAAMRVLLLLGLQDADIYNEGSIASVDGGHQFARFLAPVEPVLVHQDSRRAFDLAYRMIFASCTHRVVQGEFQESDLPLDWDGLASGLATAAAAYLLHAPTQLKN
jgi:AcrR family transcriptional regulator